MKRSLALAVCGFSLVLALVGGWLADRQFTAALDTLADQAVLQHQRNLFGYADTLQEVKADDSPHMILADDSGTRYINASDKAFAGQLYFDRQRLIVGSVPCTFALLDQTGRVIYSKLPDTIPESELAALKDADTTTMRLCGQTLLLCDQVAGASSQRVWVWMVTALDAGSAYAARTATLRQWFLLQAVLTLAALLMVHHTTALQQLNDRQSRFVADLTHELKTPLTSMIGYADLLRGGELPPENQRRAADGHAVYRQTRQPGQRQHHQHGQCSPQQGKQQSRGVSGKETAQQAPGRQDAQGRSGPQLIQGKHRDDVGQAQLHPRQGDHQRHGKQVFQGAQAQGQSRQHRAQRQLAGRYLHAAPPIPAPRRGRRHHRR